jgi:hypothetical protein
LQAPPKEEKERNISFIDCTSQRILRVCPTCAETAKQQLKEAIGAIKKEAAKAPDR